MFIGPPHASAGRLFFSFEKLTDKNQHWIEANKKYRKKPSL